MEYLVNFLTEPLGPGQFSLAVLLVVMRVGRRATAGLSFATGSKMKLRTSAVAMTRAFSAITSRRPATRRCIRPAAAKLPI